MKLQATFLFLMAMSCLLPVQIMEGGQFPRSLPRARPVVGLIDEVHELFPDTKLDRPATHMMVHAARNTVAGVLVLITGLQGTEIIHFSESDGDGKPTKGVQWYRMIDVPVTENTGVDRNTEKYSGKINPYVIRRAPFRIYDPFRPVSSPIQCSLPLMISGLKT